MFDRKCFNAALAFRGVSIDELSKGSGIKRTTLFRRLQCNGKDFTVAEMVSIANYLKLSNQEFNSIFFNQFVA